MTKIIDKIKINVLRSNAKESLVEGVKKGYEIGKAEERKRILDIYEKISKKGTWISGDLLDYKEEEIFVINGKELELQVQGEEK